MSNYANSDRRRRNEDSKSQAENDGSAWSYEELGLLATWDHSEPELDLMAELLGRTREACRERFYKLMRDGGAAALVAREVTETTTVTEKRPGRRSRTVSRTRTERTFYGNWAADEVSEWFA